jgi:hypothetical protein
MLARKINIPTQILYFQHCRTMLFRFMIKGSLQEALILET